MWVCKKFLTRISKILFSSCSYCGNIFYLTDKFSEFYLISFFIVKLQLSSHPFIRKYENTEVDLAAFVRSVFDPTQRLKDLADVSFWYSGFLSASDCALSVHVLLFMENAATDSDLHQLKKNSITRAASSKNSAPFWAFRILADPVNRISHINVFIFTGQNFGF